MHDIKSYTANAIEDIIQYGLKNGYEFEAMEAMECIRAGKKESEKVPLDETLAIMKILDTCRENAGFKYDFE